MARKSATRQIKRSKRTIKSIGKTGTVSRASIRKAVRASSRKAS